MSLVERGLVAGAPIATPALATERFGVRFPNPIGLAAGLDKNAVGVDHWHKFGFGFAEVGTITWHAQPGNPQPRLFRLPVDRALINRMGFNNEGAEAVARRLDRSSPQIPIGINLGKSKITELDAAAGDYLASFRRLRPYGAYFVVNVSSPNTPGLRTLQDREPLLRILGGLREEDADVPLFVKISPDLTQDAIEDVVQVATECRLTGIIATNTTLSREGLATKIDEAGGLSGRPVASLSDHVLSEVRRLAPAEMTLIGAGGVFEAVDVKRKQALGAHLVQIYTGWIYGGPGLVPQILRDLVG